MTQHEHSQLDLQLGLQHSLRENSRATFVHFSAHKGTLVLTALALLLALLLCLQWPLREGLQAYNRTSNDIGQLVFACLMALAVNVASWSDTHLRAHQTTPSSPSRQRWLYIACVLPWALFLLSSSFTNTWHAVQRWERFPETLTPGYWLLHLALGILALGALVFTVKTALGSHGKYLGIGNKAANAIEIAPTSNTTINTTLNATATATATATAAPASASKA
jgi:hypothetical protein